MSTGRIPLARDAARALEISEEDVRDAFRVLADAHMLVLQRGAGEVLMAMPFSAVPTPFAVESNGVRSYGNCMWDALGIPAMLHADATIATSCADCGTSATVAVKDGAVSGEGLVHFALPVRAWWNDVVFT